MSFVWSGWVYVMLLCEWRLYFIGGGYVCILECTRYLSDLWGCIIEAILFSECDTNSVMDVWNIG